MPRRKDALLVFARSPVPGRVKTRLTALISEQEAADLYEAFLQDALEGFSGLDADLRIYLAGPEAVSSDAPLAGSLDARIASARHRQRGTDLGERLLNAFVETFVAGYERVVVIGSDHPTLPLEFVGLAFEHLSVRRAVTVGPCEDGGYYLLGMNELFPSLFQDMAFSQPDVFQTTVTRAAEAGAVVTVLPRWYDVDTPQDLARLSAELAAESPESPRRTRETLAKLRSTYSELR